ncbi:MAG: PrgI family protein [Candidatus Paceibacterota bacterium]|jgi:hypothetical protein
MPYLVPKFIERQTKILGPLTFRQFIAMVGAAGICILLYFFLPLYAFIPVCAAIMCITAIMSFIKINGRDLPLIIADFFQYSFSSKIYLWKRSEISPKLIRKTAAPEKKEKEKADLLKISKSRLKNLSSEIETGQK